MDSNAKTVIFYICPNNCEDVLFYQNGKKEVTRFFDQDGEMSGSDKDYDFIPSSEIHCRKCNTVAIKKQKVTVTTVTIT